MKTNPKLLVERRAALKALTPADYKRMRPVVQRVHDEVLYGSMRPLKFSELIDRVAHAMDCSMWGAHTPLGGKFKALGDRNQYKVVRLLLYGY